MRAFVSCLVALFVLAAGAAQAVTIETVRVGNPENTGELSGQAVDVWPDRICGRVDYIYWIGKYEVTNAQYREFLNAVATVGDPNGVYNSSMETNTYVGITRSGSGTELNPYSYTLKDTDQSGDSPYENRPISHVDWYDILRFANWLDNGQPTGIQDDTTTEDGAYDMSLGSSVVRKPGALFFLPSEDEWYKAAYYDPNYGGPGVGGYWNYPTQSDSPPTREAPPGTDLINGSANYYGTPYYTPYYTTEVGAYNTTDAGGEYVSDSAYGTFDQGGNVWEWNEAHIYFGVWNRGARGAAMNDVELAMHADFRYPGWQAENTAEIGFRIASSIPEPGSMSLLVCGLAAGLIWWRRRR